MILRATGIDFILSVRYLHYESVIQLIPSFCYRNNIASWCLFVQIQHTFSRPHTRRAVLRTLPPAMCSSASSTSSLVTFACVRLFRTPRVGECEMYLLFAFILVNLHVFSYFYWMFMFFFVTCSIKLFDYSVHRPLLLTCRDYLFQILDFYGHTRYEHLLPCSLPSHIVSSFFCHPGASNFRAGKCTNLLFRGLPFLGHVPAVFPFLGPEASPGQSFLAPWCEHHLLFLLSSFKNVIKLFGAIIKIAWVL